RAPDGGRAGSRGPGGPRARRRRPRPRAADRGPGLPRRDLVRRRVPLHGPRHGRARRGDDRGAPGRGGLSVKRGGLSVKRGGLSVKRGAVIVGLVVVTTLELAG